ncbi:cysteine hydrolase [Candidatus Saccharibacteria bacterium]|nr:cysteine hydrolase [Candidatus Saccharibacteria bacterium]
MSQPYKPTLLLIDVQVGFDDESWGKRNNPTAEKNISKLLETWRNNKFPVIHVKHDSSNKESPLYPGSSGNEYKSVAIPKDGETQITKNVNSAFIGTDLEQILLDMEANRLVIVGLTTDHCVSTTTRMAANLGFSCIVANDATATFERKSYDGKHYDADTVHELALASLNDEFCEVLSTDEIIKRN